MDTGSADGEEPGVTVWVRSGSNLALDYIPRAPGLGMAAVWGCRGEDSNLHAVGAGT